MSEGRHLESEGLEGPLPGQLRVQDVVRVEPLCHRPLGRAVQTPAFGCEARVRVNQGQAQRLIKKTTQNKQIRNTALGN